MAAEAIDGQSRPIAVERGSDRLLKLKGEYGRVKYTESVAEKSEGKCLISGSKTETKKAEVIQVEEDQYQVENIVYDRVCVVCGKSLDVEEASVHLKVENQMIAICCPACYEIYQKKPNHFLALRAIRMAERRAIHCGDTRVDG